MPSTAAAAAAADAVTIGVGVAVVEHWVHSDLCNRSGF